MPAGRVSVLGGPLLWAWWVTSVALPATFLPLASRRHKPPPFFCPSPLPIGNTLTQHSYSPCVTLAKHIPGWYVICVQTTREACGLGMVVLNFSLVLCNPLSELELVSTSVSAL